MGIENKKLAAAIRMFFVAICVVSSSGLASAQEKCFRVGMPFTVVPRYFDPAQLTQATAFSVLYAIHDALVKVSHGSDPTLSIAKSFKHNADYTAFEYELNRGVLFHNGEEVTSADVKFSMERYSGTSAQDFKQKVESIDITGPYSLTVRTKESWPDYEALAHTTASGFTWIVPKKYVESVGEDGFLKHPIGTGPFEFVSNDAGRTVQLKRFDKFHGQKPKVSCVTLVAVPDAAQGLAQTISGNLDLAYGMLGELARATKNATNVKLAFSSGYTIAYLKFLDAAKPDSPWANPKVREAVNLVLDRQAISDIETLGASIPIAVNVPPSMEYAWQTPVLPVDIAKARKLMAEAGYPNGFDGGNLVPLAPYWRMAEAVTSMLGQININMRIQKLERSVFFQKLSARSLTGVCMCLEGPAGNASTRIGRSAYSKGVYHYSTVAGFDELYEKQLKETDGAKRKAILTDLQKMLYDQSFEAPIFILKYPSAVSDRVKEPAFFVDGSSYISSFESLELN